MPLLRLLPTLLLIRPSAIQPAALVASTVATKGSTDRKEEEATSTP